MSLVKNINRKAHLGFIFLLLLIFALVLAACGGQREPTTIRVAVLPILDALPMYVADEQGYFAEENLEVEFVSVSSAAERDQVIQAGQADAMINDLVSTMFYNNAKTEILIVRYARTATPTYPQYRILASSESGIMSVEDLKGQEIGVSEGTIIEYTTDRLLEAEGLSAEEIVTIAVPRIPDRMALLNSSELAAGNLPDPLASLSIQSGSRVILDDTSHPEFGHSVISFRKTFIDDNSDAVKGFLAAIEKAVVDINADKQQFASLLSDRQLVPEPILGTYEVPDFPGAAVPTTAQWEDTLEWAKEKGYIEADLEYSDSVDSSFLP